MTSASTHTSTATRAARKSDAAPDAIALLTEDHKEVKKLFKEYFLLDLLWPLKLICKKII